MRIHLLTPSPENWAEKTDLIAYSERQAQSCLYLKRVFADILGRTADQDGELAGLFRYLNGVHDRQFRDLSAVIGIPDAPDRRSFYFEGLYGARGLDIAALPTGLTGGQLMDILTIQAVAYLRGHDRYGLLKGGGPPLDLRPVYAKFFDDAIGNARRVMGYLDSHFDERSLQAGIEAVLRDEDRLMWAVWTRNGVG